VSPENNHAFRLLSLCIQPSVRIFPSGAATMVLEVDSDILGSILKTAKVLTLLLNWTPFGV
jgi:hypothetical protein